MISCFQNSLCIKENEIDDSNISGTTLSFSVHLYSAENPELDTGAAYCFPECVGLQRNWTCISVCCV